MLKGRTKPNHHEMVIIDRYDDNLDGESDGYILAESNDDEGGQVYCKKPFATYAKYCRVFNCGCDNMISRIFFCCFLFFF